MKITDKSRHLSRTQPGYVGTHEVSNQVCDLLDEAVSVLKAAHDTLVMNDLHDKRGFKLAQAFLDKIEKQEIDMKKKEKCHCDPDGWRDPDNPPAICNNFVDEGHRDYPEGYCVNCGHEAKCHL